MENLLRTEDGQAVNREDLARSPAMDAADSAARAGSAEIAAAKPGLEPLTNKPILLCDDGSVAAADAMRAGAEVLSGREAIALHVWQATSPGSLMAATVGLVDLQADPRELTEIAATAAGQAAERARAAGFRADPVAVEASGPVWQAIVSTAEARDVAVIVVGARGLSGLQRAMLGSTSEQVVRHADRPVLVHHGR